MPDELFSTNTASQSLNSKDGNCSRVFMDPKVILTMKAMHITHFLSKKKASGEAEQTQSTWLDQAKTIQLS